MAGATVELTGISTHQLDLEELGDTRITALFPLDLSEGDYTLKVFNSIGSAQSDVRILQGETGVTGATGVAGNNGEDGQDGAPKTGNEILILLADIDGADSGLDADLLDGMDSSDFATQSDHTTLAGSVSDNSTAISGLTGSVSDNSTAISGLTGTVSDNSTAISGLSDTYLDIETFQNTQFDNLLHNGSFESWNGSYPQWWMLNGTEDALIEFSAYTSDANVGATSVLLDDKSALEMAGIQQEVFPEGSLPVSYIGETLTLTLWAKKTPGSGMAIGSVEIDTGDNTTVVSLFDSDEWHMVRISHLIGAGASKLNISIFPTAGHAAEVASYLIDGAVLTTKAISPTYYVENYSKLGTEIFTAGLTGASGAAMVSDGTAYAAFVEEGNSNSGIFEVVTDGNYGIRFKRAGKIIVAYEQAYQTDGSTGYIWVETYLDNSSKKNTLGQPTGGLWQSLHANRTMQVDAGDIFSLNVGCTDCTIRDIDTKEWSTLSIMWFGEI